MTIAATVRQVHGLKIPRPHPAQMELLRHRGSTVLFAGRRFGKTQIAVYKLITSAIEIVGLYWWVGLSWRAASLKRAWRLVKFYARQMWRAIDVTDEKSWSNKSEKEITLPNKSVIWFRTAENPDSLAGEGVRGVVIDEFTLMPSEVWDEYIQAILIDYLGWAFLMGVPKGKNWGWEMWVKATSRKGWKRFHFTVYDNPHMVKSEERREFIEDIRINAPEYFWRQEYLAEVLDDGGTVFRGVSQIATVPSDLRPTAGMTYVAGVDWGRESDYTVIVMMEVETNRVVFMDRFNKIGWTLQREFLKRAIQLWQPAFILAEQNSMGSVNVEALQNEGLPVRSFETTAKSKPGIIERLAAAIERQQITIPNNPILVGELQAYTMERSVGGQFKYSAPSGMHDDCVIALALAYEAILRTPKHRNTDWLNDYRGDW